MSRARVLLLFLAALLIASSALAQARRRSSSSARPYDYLQANQWQLGFSIGGGGQQLWVGPSVDVHYGDLTLRTVPGFFYFGGGVQYRLGPKVYATDCNHRPIYVSVGYLNDWSLGPLLRGESSTLVNQDAYLLMVGYRHNLNVRGTTYLEWGIGAARVADTRRALSIEGVSVLWSPMAELRLGLIQPRPKTRYGR